jgi:lambda family phage portal protein
MTWVDNLARGVDGLVAAISPATAARRLMARGALKRLEKLSAFDGANSSRRWHNRPVSSGSADADLDGDTLGTLRDRSRDRWRNDGLAAACVQALVDNIVGVGFRPALRLDHQRLGITSDQARELERQAHAVWSEWCTSADATNRLHMDELQALVLTSALVSGDVFVQPIMVSDARLAARYELKLQIVEGDRVETPYGMPNTEQIRNGIVLGARGQPVAYYVHTGHPGDDGTILATQREANRYRRIAAHNAAGRPNLLHVYYQERPGQSRGRPFLSPVLDLFKDLDDYREAELVAAQVGACFAAFIKRTNPFDASLQAAAFDSPQQPGRQREQDLSPGSIYYLDPSEDVSFGNPTHPGGQFDAFVRSVKQSVTSGIGLPYEVAVRDFSRTTYSSARAAFVEARRMFARRQRWLTRSWLQPVWRMLLEEAYLRGLWDAPRFYDDPHAWTNTQWITPGWGWVDPLKEAQAEKVKLEMGVTTRSKIVASTDGDNWHDVAQQAVAEEVFERDIREQAGLGAVAMQPQETTTDDDAEDGDAADDTDPAEPPADEMDPEAEDVDDDQADDEEDDTE